jgi:dimethylamine monooxygenase subunit A
VSIQYSRVEEWSKSVLPYFPIKQEQYKMSMGTQALEPDLLIEVDKEHYQAEMALKERLLAEDHDSYFQEAPETEQLQWETIELILPMLARRYPDYFELTIEGQEWHWQNRLLKSESRFVFGEGESLELSPLDWLGRQVQEDLLLMQDDVAKGMPLVAGQLCFPNDWCLDDKMGQAFLTIHQPVPLFIEEIGRSSLLLLERLKVGRPVWRTNWAFKGSSRLNLTPLFAIEQHISCQQITAQNIGERCFLRMERQTLSRLPESRGVLFTVHTYQSPLAEEVYNPIHVRSMLTVLQTTPSDMIQYKSIGSFYELLIAYLENQLQK